MEKICKLLPPEVCNCVCVCVCMRACGQACMRVCVCVCVTLVLLEETQYSMLPKKVKQFVLFTKRTYLEEDKTKNM